MSHDRGCHCGREKWEYAQCPDADCIKAEGRYQKDARVAEADPTGRKPNQPGAKLDHNKPPVVRGFLHYFPRAIKAVSLVSLFGSTKYTWNGWQSVPDGYARYSDAMARHICDEAIGELPEADRPLLDLFKSVTANPTPELVHAAQQAWNAMARLELALRS